LAETVAGAPLAIDGLTKRYGRVQALAELDAAIPAGAHVGLLGPAGAGKTTLGRILAGLEPASEGRIELDGEPLAGDRHRRHRLGYVPAQPGLDEDRTPRELLRMAARLHGLPESHAERRLEQLLIDVELEHLGGHRIEHTTDGMRRRLALAYALVPDPDVLVVDEPTLGLGTEATRRVHDALTAASRERTLLVLASLPADVEALCERVLGLEDGRIVVDAGLAELAGEQGTAVDVELDGPLPQAALDRAREHGAIGALRREPEGPADLELWITDPAQLDDVLAALVQQGAPVTSFARRDPDLGHLVDQHMEASL
jgi:ABC-2 type transport system ATP-binding protein